VLATDFNQRWLLDLAVNFASLKNLRRKDYVYQDYSFYNYERSDFFVNVMFQSSWKPAWKLGLLVRVYKRA
jgi:hypothetical protein